MVSDPRTRENSKRATTESKKLDQDPLQEDPPIRNIDCDGILLLNNYTDFILVYDFKMFTPLNIFYSYINS
jgi:hypothetical protein